MLLQLPGENFLQAEIGVVFPLSTGPIFSVKSNCHNCQECLEYLTHLKIGRINITKGWVIFLKPTPNLEEKRII